jgi:ubiquinone/menaquinone biosynthesis C-methylase UbiE
MTQVASSAPQDVASITDVSPGPIIDAILGFHKTAAFKAALELDLFTSIGGGADTAPSLAAKSGAAERGLRVLCDYLTVNGFLTKAGNRYALTPSCRVFLDRRSPAYMGSVVDFLASPEHIALFLDDPVACVRNGGAVGLAGVAPNNPVWVKFAEAMIPFMATCAQTLAAQVASWATPPRKVLDIAAGHGVFGISIAKAVPGAEIVALDWEAVLALAERNAKSAGIADRFRTLAGSAFEVDWGTDYDLVLLPNFLHHFDSATCTDLLKKVRASLSPDGQAIAVEFVPNEDRVSPPFPASFAFHMLATTPKGDAYTQSGLAEMARGAGFRGVSISPLPPSPESLVIFER